MLQIVLEKPFPLSNEQKDAVLSDKKYVRVVAGAGTGKTETLTRRIIYLLLEKNIEPKNIVAFTFTEKAGTEMKSRIHSRLKYYGRTDICAKLGEMYVGTIHGFCLQILKEKFGYDDYEVFDENQEMAYIMREGFSTLELPKNGYINNCQKFYHTTQIVYNELIDYKRLQEYAPRFYSYFQKYEKILKEYKHLTFGQIIKLALEKIKENPAKIAEIKHLIVDEYQDINKAQEELIRYIGTTANVFIVGDPRQTIYQWRGADETCFERFGNEIPEEREDKSLTNNRRSGKKIIDIANKYGKEFLGEGYPLLVGDQNRGLGTALRYELESEEEEAEWIATTIKQLVEKDKKCSYGNIAILLRSVKRAGKIVDALRNETIPFIVGGKVGLFRREEVQAVAALFCWLNDKKTLRILDWGEIDTAKIVPEALKMWKKGVPWYDLPNDVESNLVKWKADTLGSAEVNLVKQYYELLNILGIKKLDPNNASHAVVLANLSRFSQLLEDYEIARRVGGKINKSTNMVWGLYFYINFYASESYEEMTSDVISALDAVFVTTIHQAKGLEWPVVFIPSLVEGKFPVIKRKQNDTMFDNPIHFEDVIRKYTGHENEERRLFYVALTRARDAVILSTYTNTKGHSEYFDYLYNDLVYEKNITSQINKIELKSEMEDVVTFEVRELIDYLKCPYFYRMRNVWTYRSGSSQFLGYGNALHLCLKRAAEIIKTTKMNPQSAVATAVEKYFYLPYAPKTLLETAKRNAKTVLANYASSHGEDIKNIEEVEVRVEFPLKESNSNEDLPRTITVVGKVDVILKNNNALEVREYKTSDTVTTDDQAAFQVKLYALGLNKLKKQIPVEQGSVAYLEEGRILPVSVGNADLEKCETDAVAIIKKILSNQVDYCENKAFCKNCDYAKICPRGV